MAGSVKNKREIDEVMAGSVKKQERNRKNVRTKKNLYNALKLKKRRIEITEVCFILENPQPHMGFPGVTEVKASACNERDLGSIPGSRRSPREGNCNPFQYSYLENSMDRGAW